jgi:hypothetical protein
VLCLVSSLAKCKRAGKDTSDAYGIRGAGPNSALTDFGQPIDLQDLLFRIKREPIAKHLVFDVAHDVFDKWFKVEPLSEKPDSNFDKTAPKSSGERSIDIKKLVNIARTNPCIFYYSGAGGEIRTHVLLRDGILSPAHKAPYAHQAFWFDLALLPLHACRTTFH